jgi:hypothetical protein
MGWAVLAGRTQAVVNRRMARAASRAGFMQASLPPNDKIEIRAVNNYGMNTLYSQRMNDENDKDLRDF